MIRRLSVVGLGLLGGSLAKAVRAESLAGEIIAVGRRRESLEAALREGVIDRATTDLAEGVTGADLCVLATPVTTLESLLPAVWAALPPEAVLTDVGSTKAGIVRAAERLAERRAVSFVGSHPMAGSERNGYGVARADLFRGATVILTPTERSHPNAVKRVTDLWEAVGARVMHLDPRAHDRAVAAVSHVPHLVADALVEAVLRLDPAFLDIAARGFKDTTRIAASSPSLWRQIFQENRVAVGEALAVFRSALDDLDRVIASGDAAAVERALERIKQAREGLS